MVGLLMAILLFSWEMSPALSDAFGLFVMEVSYELSLGSRWRRRLPWGESERGMMSTWLCSAVWPICEELLSEVLRPMRGCVA